MNQVVQDRLEKLNTLQLLNGGHKTPEDGMCAMEAVAWLAGEEHSDRPACACPVLSAFLRSWNDRVKDTGERTALLRPLLTKLVGSKSSAAVAEKRSYLALDWLIRTSTPAWLDLRDDLNIHASSLRGLSPIVDLDSARKAGEQARRARSAADAAASAAYAAYTAAYAYGQGSEITRVKREMQISALDLFERMLAVTE